MSPLPTPWRNTTQNLAPVAHPPTKPGAYDLYPSFSLTDGAIQVGFDTLAAALANESLVVIDGYAGVFWEDFRAQLESALQSKGVNAAWVNVNTALRPEAEIDALIAPFLGGDDPIFGTRFTGSLGDFFQPEALAALQPASDAAMTILYGCGAALANWPGRLVYVDLPKNELQFRARAGSITNLGASAPFEPKPMYKRFYFVDWIALNHHKDELLPQIDWIVDGQRPDAPTWMTGDALRNGLATMSRNFFRVRPWFEPGAWGGQWIKEKIPQLPQDVINYAWSFELIVPENGLLFESDGNLLEVSFDLLMMQDSEAILGDSASFFGLEFPIRFDFLDTFAGGNLSLQCHPRPDFIREHFGERFTQDETYYILDCAPDATVYLGFREEIDPAAFRAALEKSFEQSEAIDVEQFVNILPAQQHDLFLIPNGTIHCSGINNLVLEISATPYIFTFKMYDWMRLDLDGRPRPLNIERAFANLRFEMKGEKAAELVSRPTIIERGDGWQLVHLPTHPIHFYDVHRLEFQREVTVETGHSCHVLSLVEGASILLETANGMRQRFNFAETFVVPAAAGRYRLLNEDEQPVKVIKAFVKPDLPATI